MSRVPESQTRDHVRRAQTFGFARRRGSFLLFTLCCLFVLTSAARLHAQPQSDLTPLQREIRVQTERLSSIDVEERRDAVMRLGAMARPEGSRAAASALADSSAIVRAMAAHAVLSLGRGEAATLILPLLRDRDEFVRREAAYALGLTRSPTSVTALNAAVETDKKPSVRGAAAVALGQIGDAGAAPALAGALARRLPATGFFNRLRRKKVEEDEFVRRAAAIALGQIASRESVPALVEALSDTRAPSDVRRECARALGNIGDPAAVPALRSALSAQDPYLSRIAFEALRKIDPQRATRPS